MSLEVRVNYFDNLRAIACIAVILLHISGPFLYSISNPIEFQYVNFLHSLSRFCVPIFLMITGALMLGNNYSWQAFYKEKIPKLFKPFIFWSIFYLLINTIYNYSINDSYSLQDFLAYLKVSIIYGSAYHLWYMYLIIAIYLALPFLANFNKRFYKKHILYLVLLWLFVLTIAQFFPQFKLLGYLRFGFGYFGYLVLGYYCSKASTGKVVSISIFILGLLSTFLPNFYSTKVDYNWYYYLNVNVVLLSAGLFLTIKSISLKSAFLNSIAKYSFGIYFIHLFFIMFLNKIWIYESYYAPAQIIMSTLLCLILSYFAILLLRRIKPLTSFIY